MIIREIKETDLKVCNKKNSQTIYCFFGHFHIDYIEVSGNIRSFPSKLQMTKELKKVINDEGSSIIG